LLEFFVFLSKCKLLFSSLEKKRCSHPDSKQWPSNWLLITHWLKPYHSAIMNYSWRKTNLSQLHWGRWLIDDYCELKLFAQSWAKVSIKWAALVSNGCCFLWEITQYSICWPVLPAMLSIHGYFVCWMDFSFSPSTEVRRSLGLYLCL